MKPIKSNESNFTYRGPTPEIADLPCRKEGENTFSIWELNKEERSQIAAGANIRLGIYGVHPIPPVSLQVVPDVGPYARKGTPISGPVSPPKPDKPIEVG